MSCNNSECELFVPCCDKFCVWYVYALKTGYEWMKVFFNDCPKEMQSIHYTHSLMSGFVRRGTPQVTQDSTQIVPWGMIKENETDIKFCCSKC